MTASQIYTLILIIIMILFHSDPRSDAVPANVKKITDTFRYSFM